MNNALDRWITADLGGRNTQELYEAASDGDPLVESAAASLVTAADAEKPIVVATGFPIPPSGRPETDGPLGAVVLASALDALGAEPVVVTELAAAEPIRAVADALGSEPPEIVAIQPSGDDSETETTLTALLDREPGAIVTVEKPGRTADGSYPEHGRHGHHRVRR